MTFLYNPLPIVSEAGLERMERIKENLRDLKVYVYGPDSNKYEFCESGKLKSIIPKVSKKELEMEVQRILPESIIKEIKREQKELRSKIDHGLAKVVMEEILPRSVSPKALVEYDFYVRGRDMSQIDSKTDPRRGSKDIQHRIVVLPVEEWVDAWKEYIISDESLDSNEMNRLPEGTNRLVSTLHKLYVVKKVGKPCQKRNNQNNHNNGFLPGYEIDGSKFEIDFRTKSGAELMWKYTTYLTGLEEKPKNTRESIVDMAGFRLLYTNGFEENSIRLYQDFMSKYKGDCDGSLILQVLNLNQDEQRSKFLENIETTKLRNLCRRILLTEDRSGILSQEDVKNLGKKYYLEMLIPFCATSNNYDHIFGRNVINGLSYHLETYKKIHQKKDDLIYKGRGDEWRDEHYTYLEWYLIDRLAPALLSGDSLRYMKEVVESKIGKGSKE